MSKRFLILGCGGVGGVAATLLFGAGHEVVTVTNNPEITDAITAEGLHAQVGDEFHRAEIEAVTSLQSASEFDYVLVATPPNAAEQAVVDVLDLIPADVPIVTFPNGLIEERLAKRVGEERLIGGIVSYGALMNGPGRVHRTAQGGVTLGRLSGEIDEHVLELQQLLAPLGQINVTDNLAGARWSKLALNCAVSTLGTVGGDRLGALLRHRFVRRLALEIMTEVVRVAQAQDVELEKVAGTLDLDWLALDADEALRSGSPSLLAKHAVLLGVGTKYRKMRSSMLRAIERGRKPPVDQLNGEIVERGLELNVQTPVNTALLNAVHQIADGELENSLSLLREVYSGTRETLRDIHIAA